MKDKNEYSSLGNKYLDKVKCFRCHQLGNYAIQCLEKKGKAKHVVVGTIEGVDEGSSQFETSFSMVSCLCSSIVSVLDGMWVVWHQDIWVMIGKSSARGRYVCGVGWWCHISHEIFGLHLLVDAIRWYSWVEWYFIVPRLKKKILSISSLEIH